MNERQLPVRLDFENREIAAPVDAEHGGRILLLVLQRHRDIARAGNHVIIGENFAVFVDDES